MSHLLRSYGDSFLKHSEGRIIHNQRIHLEKKKEREQGCVAQTGQQYHPTSVPKQRSPAQKSFPFEATRTAPTISRNHRDLVRQPPAMASPQSPHQHPPFQNHSNSDICIGDEKHSGNHKFRRIVQDYIIQELFHNQQNSSLPKYTPTVYMTIVNQLKGRGTTNVQFYIVSGSPEGQSFRLATTKEKIDYVRKCYEATAAAAEATLTATAAAAPITAR
jgi:hypothetical protein